MKNSTLVLTVFIAGFSINSQAKGSFVGGELSYTQYPQWADRVTSNAYANGASYSITNAQSTYIGLGMARIAGGYHFSQFIAAEIGYTKFSDVTANLTSGRGTSL